VAITIWKLAIPENKAMKSKLLLCLALVLSGVLPGCRNLAQCADTSSGIKIMIDAHASYYPETHRMEPPTLHLVAHQGHQFYVILENTSATPLYLTKENGEILYLCFEITTDDGQTIIARQVPPASSAHIVEESQIDPGQVMVVKVNYHTSSPSPFQSLIYPFPFPPSGQARKVTIRAVLEAKPAGGFARGSSAWSGKAASKPYHVILKNDSDS
jgi:hypothetical protein